MMSDVPPTGPPNFDFIGEFSDESSPLEYATKQTFYKFYQRTVRLQFRIRKQGFCLVFHERRKPTVQKSERYLFGQNNHLEFKGTSTMNGLLSHGNILPLFDVKAFLSLPEHSYH